MKTVEMNCVRAASKFIGASEVPGIVHNPLILAMLQLDAKWVQDDETAWCSAFVNFICFFLDFPRTRSLSARSWLQIGQVIKLEDAEVGNDIVILKRGKGKQPGPETISAPGHVGFYAGHDKTYVHVLGGNQSNSVSIAKYKVSDILGVRRIG
jgi:uncharacterized protein (TIGR02594 family)